MELFGFSVADFGGFDLVVEEAEVILVAVVFDLGFEFVTDAADAEVGGRLAAGSGVAAVLLGGAGAEVGAAVVESVAVDVVDDVAGGRGHEHLVHGDGLAVDDGGGVEAAAGLLGVPAELAEVVEVGGVDDGELALGQGDVADVVGGRGGGSCGSAQVRHFAGSGLTVS